MKRISAFPLAFQKPDGPKPLRLGLVGLGRWGTNYAETIRSIDGLELCAIATKSQRPKMHGETFQTCNWLDFLALPELDGVIIASSPEMHFKMAATFLAKGLPVLLEKPACFKVLCCEALMKLSFTRSTPCVVGYTHLYSSAYRSLKRNRHANNAAPKIRSSGLSNGPFRTNVDVLWDWGSHDVAMCLDFLSEFPVDVTVKLEESEPSKPNACIYSLGLRFPSGATSISRFGNISPVKERTFCVSSKHGETCYDGLDQKLVEINGTSKRHFDYSQAPLPLTNLIVDFANCILNKDRFHPSLALAVEVTKVLSTAEFKLIYQKRK